MSKYGYRARCAGFLLASTALATGSLLPLTAEAGSASIVDVEDATSFIGYAGAFYTGTLASVSYTILPNSGSVTRPLTATYSANYLSRNNYFIPGANAVVIPVFGLYSGTRNTVNINYTFTDGTVSAKTTTITTPSYTDPCAQINQRTFLQERQVTSALNFDYFELKDYCSANSPAILDTDGNIRWVGNINANDGASDTAFFNNAFYYSNGKTGINQISITNGQVTQVGDYASIGVTATNQHNMDPGKTGLLVEVNTTSELEAAAIEIDPTTGAVLNTWDFGAIISAAMTAGGDNPANFVLGTTADWFHNNALAYNPADNTLIVSSRENFVMAVDYNPPASGQRQIHWILGDTTKAWGAYNSLKKYALTLASGTLPPIGQHAVSIDHLGNLLLFDDGLGSLTLSPAGATRSYSAARAYQINTTAKTATATYTYTAANANVDLFSPICGSVYDVGGNYLVDFATTNDTAAVAAATAGQSPASIVATLETGVGTSVILVGVGNAGSIQFVTAIPSPGPCSPGWNAVPFASNTFTFN